MAHCSFKHEAFKEEGYRSDGTNQCWVDDDVAAFGKSALLCVFHAPATQPSADRTSMPRAGRDARQAALLRRLLDDWNKQNRARNEPLAFHMPQLQCGELILNGYEFSGEVDFRNASFNGQTDFQSAVFNGPANFVGATFQAEASFESATFCDEVGFQGTTFSGWTDFDNCTFRQMADFQSAEFYKTTGFADATFKELSEFSATHFRGLTYFDRARFGRAEFRNTKFDGFVAFDGAAFEEANFRSVVFKDNVTLDDSKFEAAVFDNSTFTQGVNIRGVRAGSLLLHRLHLERPSSLVQCEIGSLSYIVHTGESLVFNDCEPIIENSVQNKSNIWDFRYQDGSKLVFVSTDLSRAFFLGAELHSTRFDSCTWIGDGRPSYRKVADHEPIFDEPDQADPEKRKEHVRHLELLQSLYQKLKKNLEEERSYIQSGEFHYWEMRIRQRLLRIRGGQWWHRALLGTYRLLADFGESYKKLLL